MTQLKNLQVKNKTVLVAANLDVPIQNNIITDDTRLKSNIPTYQYLISNKAKVIITGHIGRPKGEVNPELSTKQLVSRLSELLNTSIKYSSKIPHKLAAEEIKQLKPGEVLLLENMYFDKRNREGDEQVAKEIAPLIDYFVNDAYCDAHRKNSYNAHLPKLVPSTLGIHFEQELKTVLSVRDNPKKPLVTIIGGAKADKIGVINHFLATAEHIILGGVLANTFLKAAGYDIKASRYDERSIEIAGEFLREQEEKFLLPKDVVVADEFSEQANHKVVPVTEIPDGWMIMDVGPQTIKEYSEVIKKARTIIWGGPIGVFEMEEYRKGTVGVASAAASSQAFSLVAGGDSQAALKLIGMQDRISHLSIGGGATLELIGGGELPAVTAIKKSPFTT